MEPEGVAGAIQARQACENDCDFEESRARVAYLKLRTIVVSHRKTLGGQSRCQVRFYSFRSWNYLEQSGVPGAEDSEVPVQGKYSSDTCLFGKHHQRSIREVHRQVSVLTHQRSHPGKVRQLEVHNEESMIEQKFPKQVTLAGPGEKVEGLCEDGPSGHQFSAEALQRRATLPMGSLIRVE
jgi:hypothetical protein